MAAPEREVLERMRPRCLDRAIERLFGASALSKLTEELRLRDLAQGEVELLEVKATRVVEVEPRGGEGPLVFFEAAESQAVVVLAGPWIDDPHRVGFDAEVVEPNPTNWFTHFTVERTPHLGNVFRVTVHGGAAAPTRVAARVPFLLECEVLPGSLEQLDDVLSHAALAKARGST